MTKIITLCGSTRFKREYEEAEARETMAGKIVLTCGLFGHADNVELTEEQKMMLDELHLKKIAMSNEVLVIDAPLLICPRCNTKWRHDHVRVQRCSCGAEISDVQPSPYFGDSTRREIAYAVSLGIPVRYLSQEDQTND